MSGAGIAQIAIFFVVLFALAIPLGSYMARVYEGKATTAQKLFGWLERLLYRLLGVDPEHDQTWQRYAVALLLFNVVGLLLVYGLQRLQGVLPGNPNDLAAVDPRVAWNSATSFASNTNWQAYGGETTMSNLVQALALGVQNFLSAATGMAVLIALVRGFTRKHSESIGSFWVDLTRSIVYILLPLSILFAVFLVAQGVPQTTDGMAQAQLIEPTSHLVDGKPVPVVEQGIAIGPVASQVAIKQLGTNGGGFYNANSAHPLENPTPLSNFFECLAILLIAAGLCFTFGKLVKSRRQGIALLAAMTILVVPFLVLTTWAESQPNTAFVELPVDQLGNMEGKEVRFGVGASTLWATATTAASNGSVNSMHDSYSPLGGLGPMVLMQLGEVAFGGVGSGLYGLLTFAIVAVFISGLMVGRTPELLGKKIEAFEMKMASLAILVPCVAVLLGTAFACVAQETYDPSNPATTVLNNPGPHGFSEILYAFSSMGNNNGSAFAGVTASKDYFATAGGICMFVARYWTIIPVLAIAGALARKKSVPPSSGTLPTDGPLFVVLLVGTVVLVGALTFVPALALGPIVEALQGVSS